jgi:hypothetical protein
MSAYIRTAGNVDAGRFSANNHQFVPFDILGLESGATLTETDSGDTIELTNRRSLVLVLDVTAHTAGGDTLDVTVQTSGNGSTWRTLGTFTQSTATGSERKSFPGADRYVRYAATLAGAGVSTTFTITGEAS